MSVRWTSRVWASRGGHRACGVSSGCAAGLLLSMVLLLGACSTARPWINQPLSNSEPVSRRTVGGLVEPDAVHDLSMLVAVTLSGGGARAAAFGYGVLDGLRQVRFPWNGVPTSLLDEIDVISGVSGGSIIAGYFAAFGQQTFPSFEREFLHKDFQDTLVNTLLLPATLHELSSPWIGRSHLLERRLSELYQGKTFGDLKTDGAPRLLVTATDLSLGTAFEFTEEQFELICSDLSSVPLSFAVAASSAVPIVLSPMTLRNHADQCPRAMASQSPRTGNDNYRARMMRQISASYRDAKARPYIHLVDGGLADNLGVRRLLDRTLVAGGLQGALRNLPPGSVRKLVLVTVNSERDPTEHIDRNGQVPTTLQVLDALLFGAGSRATQETLGLLSDVVAQWRREVGHHRGDGRDVFAPDASIHSITLNLRDAPAALDVDRLLQIPTAFSVSRGDVDLLIRAGRRMLLQSPQLRLLADNLGARWPESPIEP